MGEIDPTAPFALDIVEVLELLATRYPSKLGQGERKLTVVYSGGKVRRAFLELGPLRPDELVDVVR